MPFTSESLVTLRGTPSDAKTKILIHVESREYREEFVAWQYELINQLGDFFRQRGANFADIKVETNIVPLLETYDYAGKTL